MANPFNPSGGGPDKTSLPNMGSPFAQNPQQQTNPFMGSTGSNNASASPFSGAGFKNPFSGEHAGGGNPFGGGTAGGGIKGLIDSNNKLIQAINKLTTIFEKLVGKTGQGGIGTAGAMGGGISGGIAGIFGGTDTLQASQMRRLAAGGMGGGGGGGNRTNPFTGVNPFSAAAQNVQDANMTNIPGVQQTFTNNFQQQFQQGMADQRQQQADQRATRGVFGTGYFARHAQFTPQYADPANPTLGEYAQQYTEHYNQNQAQTDLARSQFHQRLRQGAMQTAQTAAVGGARTATSIGSSQTFEQMLSQIPYIGSLLAIGPSALMNRINTHAPREQLARLVAQQGGIAQTGNMYRTQAGLFNAAQALGISAPEALQESLSFQENLGQLTGANPMGNLLGQGTLMDLVGRGFTGQTVGSFMRMNRADRMVKFDPNKIFGYGLSLGLGDQGMMELAGAAESLQNLAPGMGYKGNANAIISQAANNTNRGFIGTQGFIQAQRQIQGTAEMGRGLKGIFGGLAETLTMASFLGQYGDPTKAIRAFESTYATNPAALKDRLTKQFGGNVTEMAYLANMTSADYDNIGSGQFAQGALPGVDTGDIRLSKKVIGKENIQGFDLYDKRVNVAERLLDINAKIEQRLIEGITIKRLDQLEAPVIKIADGMQKLVDKALPIAEFMLKRLSDIVNLLDMIPTPW